MFFIPKFKCEMRSVYRRGLSLHLNLRNALAGIPRYHDPLSIKVVSHGL